ncbi:MAG TPA: methyltransferase domain-containing protein [Gammaproteobacteria bacterium]|nr:methyltransferase domain-containing protein [Gammaproteobacteria bacterium]
MLGKIKHAFNQAAHTYDAAASAQHAAGAHLIECLPNHTYQNVLDLGCGTGHTTNALATQLHFNGLQAIDTAPSALTLARNTCKHPFVNFIEADFNEYQPTHRADLIFSNMALHWGLNLKNVLARCHQLLNENGILAFSLPLAHTFHELNGIAAKRALPEFTDVLSLLETHLKLIHLEKKQYQTSHENTLACLRAIKKNRCNRC